MYQKLDFLYIMFFEIVLLAYMQTIIYIILPRKYTTVFVKTKKKNPPMRFFDRFRLIKKFSFWQSLRHFFVKMTPPFTQRRLSGSLH